ncbi:MFS transporter [Acidisoma sp. 7E03]
MDNASETETPTARASWRGLRAFNFFAASLQTGYGPFLPVYLTRAGWSQGQVGLALSVGSIAGMVSQVPAGLLVDHLPQRRLACGVALAGFALGMLILAVHPGFLPVLGVEVLHGFAAAMLAPAIAALTLSLGGRGEFGEHVGRNQRYASLGNALAAALLGLVAWHLSIRAAFLLAAVMALPAALCLFAIRPVAPPPPQAAEHPAMLHPKARDARFWQVFFEGHMHTFAVCVTLFTLANAAMLPLALNALAHRHGGAAIATTGSIIALQAVVVVLAPRLGQTAERWGRRPVLLMGFSCLVLRALLLSTNPGAAALIAIELLDGAAAASIGVMIPLVAADLTEKTGYLNLAIGSFGLAGSLGATFSTTLAGWIADRYGLASAFYALTLPALLGIALILLLLPETRPVAKSRARGRVAPAGPAASSDPA